MGFVQIGQEWRTWTPSGVARRDAQQLRPGQWCWVERTSGESGLCPVGEAISIELAVQLMDESGQDIPGGLERLDQWETIANRRGLDIPRQRSLKGIREKSPKRRAVKRREST